MLCLSSGPGVYPLSACHEAACSCTSVGLVSIGHKLLNTYSRVRVVCLITATHSNDAVTTIDYSYLFCRVTGVVKAASLRSA